MRFLRRDREKDGAGVAARRGADLFEPPSPSGAELEAAPPPVPAPPPVLVTATPAAGGAAATAAALALARAGSGHGRAPERTPLLVDLEPGVAYRPAVLAADGARSLASLAGELEGWRAVARGRLCVAAPEPGSPADDCGQRLGEVLDAGLASAAPLVVHAPAPGFRSALARAAAEGTEVLALIQGSTGLAERDLLGALSMELRAERVRHRIWRRSPGAIQGRRALAGLDPGGETSRRAARAARALGSESGQAVPAMAGLLVAVIVAALAMVALGGALTAKGRAQRAADLAALSAARSMRDDFGRLFIPAYRADGTPDPRHLDKADYEERARAAARTGAQRNGLDPGSLRVSFPDGDSIAPLRVEVSARPEIEIAGSSGQAAREAKGERTQVDAEAALSPPVAVPAAGASGATTMASGGGYSGPLEIRQGKPMRPDVAAAFDAMSAAAAKAGVTLTINSAFRSDAEQARLFAANPDPRMVARPGTSLHRCGTELDLGASDGYAWLRANAGRFGFLQRYSWEAWHYGYTAGPEPCSKAGDSVGTRAGVGAGGGGGKGGDGRSASGEGLPGFVPPQFRKPLLAAAARHDVSAAVLAAQLMAESNFNPAAVSAAGAQGIAQFMPGTADAYGLDDPFDPVAAIDAQARLMSDLLGQFGSVELALAAYNAGPGAVASCNCVPPYPETQAYVARIVALLDGAGQLGAPAPALEVRLVA